MKLIICCFVFTFCFKGCTFTVKKLGAYGADRNKTSCSGFSSGAYMTTQFYVAHSSELIGAGIIAGGPYYCARGLGWLAFFGCSKLGIAPDLSETLKVVERYARLNLIDPTENIGGDNIYIFSGKRDDIVNPVLGPIVEKFYRHFNANVLTEFNVDVRHEMPTPKCSCNYNTAYILLNHIYGKLRKSPENTQIKENLFKFNQGEFTIEHQRKSSMDNVAYVYVPTYCQKNEGCPLHIALHGSSMGREKIGEEYVRNAGYNDVAEANNIIILYPQIVTSFWDPFNPIGSFDWLGFTGQNYATKEGVQIKILYQMMQKICTKV